MNRGDSSVILLNIEIDKVPLAQNYATEIELTFNPQKSSNCVQKKLTAGTIYWDANEQKYACMLTQNDTFKMLVGDNSWHLRVLISDVVTSTKMGYIKLGDANSARILGV